MHCVSVDGKRPWDADVVHRREAGADV